MIKFSDAVLLNAVRDYLATSSLVGYINTVVVTHVEMRDRLKDQLSQVIGKTIDGLFAEDATEAEATEAVESGG